MAAARRRLVLKAHAKINLHLDVGPLRADGYHDLRTLFQEISLHDTLQFSPAEHKLTLEVTPKGLPTGPDNLVMRALEKLRASLRIKKGARVRLIKRIPVGAGLGGGSSDAAAALLGGWALWKGRGRVPSRIPPTLVRIARTLGADVPFFLVGGTAWGEGVGERLTAVPEVPRRWLVLVYPRVQVSTKVAYRLLDQARHRKPSTNGHRVDAIHLRPSNSFESVILPRFQAVANARTALARAGCGGVLMSGSGSSVFGFAGTRRDAERMARRLRKKPWDVFVAHTL